MEGRFELKDFTPFFSIFSLFAVLRITEVIHWSWLWVSGPLWIPALLFFLTTFILERQERTVIEVEETVTVTEKVTITD